MSFSLWPQSSNNQNPIASAVGDDAKPSTPALDFIQVLQSHSLKISSYRAYVGAKRLGNSEPIGSGGQATISLSNRPGVVIKRTRRLRDGDGKHISNSDKDLARLTAELRILKWFSSQYPGQFVKVMGICFEEPFFGLDSSSDGRFHLLLEHSELGDMASFLRRNGPQLDTETKIDLAFQVSAALVALHMDLICHGDVKIQNVLLFRNKNGLYGAKLADFGLSVHAYSGYLGEDSEGSVYCPVGTPLLNAPETRNQAFRVVPVDVAAAIRTDVFSLGLLVWETLNNGQSFFDVTWLDRFRTLTRDSDLEEKMAFLSDLPPNGLLAYGKAFLSAQRMDEMSCGQALRTFEACLQDDPLQRQPMHRIWTILCPEAKKASIDFEEFSSSTNTLQRMHHGLETWGTQAANVDFRDYTCLNLPMSLQKRSLDELKIYATSSKPHGFIDNVRRKAALNLAECYLLAFGTTYDSKEAVRWLQAAKSFDASCISLGRLSEALGPLPSEVTLELRSQRETIQIPRLEGDTSSELYLMRKIQSRAVSAANQIRDPLPEGALSGIPPRYIGMLAATILYGKLGRDTVGWADMTHLDIAALLGNDEVMLSILADGEAITDCGTRINALHFACIGDNFSSLGILLEHGANIAACGENDITPLHLTIYMPVDEVEKAVSLLIARGASTEARSKKTRLRKTTIDLVGTPVEWAVIARHRSLVKALLPHSKGQERQVLEHAISYAYYEIAEDLLSNGALSGSFSQADCPVLNYSRVFAHLFAHGRDGDIAIDRTIRLCHKHGLINYTTMLCNCIFFARSRSCLKALEVLLELCPPSIIRQGFDSDIEDEVMMSLPFIATLQPRTDIAWKPVLEAIFRNFSADELGKTRKVKDSGSEKSLRMRNVLVSAVASGSTIGAQVLLEQGVHRYERDNEHSKESVFVLAAKVGNVEMQALMSKYREENADSVEEGVAQLSPSPTWWDPVHKDIAREQLTMLNHENLSNVQSPATIIVAKAHKVLKSLLIIRDVYFSKGPSNEYWCVFDTSPLDAFQALLRHEAMAGNIDAPDELNVTMLQRAAAYLDLDVVRLLLEAGADANVPFSVKKEAGDDKTDVAVPFLPFQIAIGMSLSSRMFAEGTISPAELHDPISRERTNPEPTTKPQLLRRVAQAVSKTVETGVKRIQASTNGRALTRGEKLAESFKNDSLRVAQEFLKWHLLRNDPRFEGITEYHITCQSFYVSHMVKLLRKDPKLCDVKASWPGLNGKYTGQEMVHMFCSSKQEWKSFFLNFGRLRGHRSHSI